MSTKDKFVCILSTKGQGGCVNLKDKVLQLQYCQQKKKRAAFWKAYREKQAGGFYTSLWGILQFWLRYLKLKQTCNVGDEKTVSMEQWWNDTDRGKMKYWEKNIIQRGW